MSCTSHASATAARRIGPMAGLGVLVAVVLCGLALAPGRRFRGPAAAISAAPALVPEARPIAPPVALMPETPVPAIAAGGLGTRPGCALTVANVAQPPPRRAVAADTSDLQPLAPARPPTYPKNSTALPENVTYGALGTAAPSQATAPDGRATTVLPILPFVEAHWQGIEALPNTPVLAKSLGIPADAKGVIIDEATMPADAAGFLAGDLIVSVGQVPTPDLMALIDASSRVRARRRVEVEILRKGATMRLVLVAMMQRLGTANGETAQTIQPGARAPHDYQGPCTNCHRIGSKAQLGVDQGDQLVKNAPPIQSGAAQPHKDRGLCTSCHKILPAAAKASTIRADAVAPHEARGACSGCHNVQLTPAPGAVR